MKRIALLTAAVFTSITLANSAFALSFSVDVPVQFTLANKNLTSPSSVKPKDSSPDDLSGVIVSASVGWLGVGYENYNVAGKAVVSPGGNTIGYTQGFKLYDVFLDLPFPVVNLALGYGKGTASTDLKDTTGPPPAVKDADVTQSFVRLGMPIGKVFDLHVGYHVLTAQDQKIPNSGGFKWNGSGKALTAGVRLGW